MTNDVISSGIQKNEFIHFACIPDIRLACIAFVVIAFDHLWFFDDNSFGTFELHFELSRYTLQADIK